MDNINLNKFILNIFSKYLCKFKFLGLLNRLYIIVEKTVFFFLDIMNICDRTYK